MDQVPAIPSKTVKAEVEEEEVFSRSSEALRILPSVAKIVWVN